MLDEAEAATLLRQAQDEQIEALARADAPAALRNALATVARRISIAEYAELMKRLLGERAWLLARIADEAGLKRLARRLRRRLQCELVPALDEASLRAAARALIEAGGKTDGARGETIAAWLAADSDRDDAAAPPIARCSSPTRARCARRWPPRPRSSAMPDIDDILRAEAERLECARGLALVELTSRCCGSVSTSPTAMPRPSGGAAGSTTTT